VVLAEDRVNPRGAVIVPELQLSESVDLCVVLGGDGTMLRASKAVASEPIPLLGINLGRLGFLSPFDPADAQGALERAVDGKLDIVERMRLAVTYRPLSGVPVTRTALNDVVINQGAMARLIELQAFLDDVFITSFRSDGLVVASPTGSTAYNLAAGGPIVYPGHQAIAITPICAQGLTHRPIVVPATGVVRITMSCDSLGVVMTVDGQWARTFQHGDEIEVTASKAPLRVFASDTDYFDILRTKLHWGVRPDKEA
jgi:NAD+ kinase